MVLFPNASVTISRVQPTPGGGVNANSPQVIARNVSCKIAAVHVDFQLPAGATGAQYDYSIVFDVGVPVKIGDRVTGWNPLDDDPAPTLVVRRVVPPEGPILPHIEAMCIDSRTKQ